MSQREKSSLPAALFVLAVTAPIYLWLRTGGTFTRWTHYGDRYSELTASFLHGRVSLATVPPPELLALPNPYDPMANNKYRLHDASLYKGKYYFYWGPVPALMAAAVYKVIGVTDPSFGDETIGFIFQCGASMLMAVLLFQIRARLFPNQSPGTAVPAILSMTLATPILSSVNCLSTYEAAIIAGQFFLLAGMCMAWIAVRDGRARYGLLAAASACWGLSAGSRISLPPALALLAGFTLWHFWRSPAGKGVRPKIYSAAALILPLAAAGMLMGWYNYVRFDNFFEAGASLQLGGQDQTHPISSGFFSWRHIVPNALAYLLTAPSVNGIFPYLQVIDAYPWLASLFKMPDKYFGGSITGLVWTQPFLLLSVAAVWMQRRRSAASGPSTDSSLESWLVISSFVCAIVAMMPVLAIGFLAVRYLIDAIPLLSIAAAIGYWRLLEALRDRPRAARELRGAVRTLAILEGVAGTLLAVSRSPAAFYRAARWFPFF